MSEIERLSGDFNRGYTKAIMDIKETFDLIDDDLKCHHKKLNYRLAKELLDCILENREKLRDEWDGFIRWNGSKNRFEFYKPVRAIIGEN